MYSYTIFRVPNWSSIEEKIFIMLTVRLYYAPNFIWGHKNSLCKIGLIGTQIQVGNHYWRLTFDNAVADDTVVLAGASHVMAASQVPWVTAVADLVVLAPARPWPLGPLVHGHNHMCVDGNHHLGYLAQLACWNGRGIVKLQNTC